MPAEMYCLLRKLAIWEDLSGLVSAKEPLARYCQRWLPLVSALPLKSWVPRLVMEVMEVLVRLPMKAPRSAAASNSWGGSPRESFTPAKMKEVAAEAMAP